MMTQADFINEITEPIIASAGKLSREESARLQDVYEQYAEELGHYLRHITPSQQVAEDMLAETFISLARAIKQERTIENMRAYLYMIAKNKVKDYFRSKKRLERPDDEYIRSDRDESMSTKREHAKILAIRETIMMLEEVHQEILILHDLEGYKQREIAQRLDIPMGTVNSRIRAARKKFIERFQAVQAQLETEGGRDD